eukprot:SAG25_NODE_10844_length_321_cov_1.130631_1_plen_88_part_10
MGTDLAARRRRGGGGGGGGLQGHQLCLGLGSTTLQLLEPDELGGADAAGVGTAAAARRTYAPEHGSSTQACQQLHTHRHTHTERERER